MTEKRTPRRRVQRAQTQNNAEVILLPAPNHTTTAFRQKSDTGRIESLNRGGRSAQRRRKQEQRAASIARSSLAQIAGTPTRARGSSRVDLQACKLGTGRRFTTS